MEDRKEKLLTQKNKLEEQIKKAEGKLKLIKQELYNIELKEKAKNADQVIEKLKEKGINDIDSIETLLTYINQGKINVK